VAGGAEYFLNCGMKHSILCLFLLGICLRSIGQDIYFPPTSGNNWDTYSISELGWCEDSLDELFTYLDESNTKAFMVLKDGKIVIEHYFDEFTQDSVWYWASAGKSLTSFLVGMAQEDGLLDINNPTSDYLGQGWSSLTPEQEELITVRHQLTMTTGLSDQEENADCTDPECLVYLENPGERWAYHNAPYTLLDGVIENATGQGLNAYLLQNVGLQTGLYGLYVQVDYNNVFFSTPRVFARFGSLILNEANWNGNQILGDMDYFQSMISPSQNLNESYGYLWWLNGSDSYMLPGSQFVFPGLLTPDAPEDMFSAMGKNGQILNIVPSQNLTVIRMGEAPTNEIFFVPNVYNNTIWQYLNGVICEDVGVNEKEEISMIEVYPNPASDIIRINGINSHSRIQLFDAVGKNVFSAIGQNAIPLSEFSDGIYTLVIQNKNETVVKKLTIQ
jgi:CubicO group peptidase (beta-lactamase class C family)